ncbi:hypothetical protein FISHEDRAFT_63108 [Fistulina hepatica ATCC 64428]|uniref:Uncharacterized protein n=1 Tax=Fistulina hepatica ATCC 64428 TaxID=1128425 RepID=A0A0D6ZZ70_9AGAR|nr:hypothetical protein FISHEDRAFT_63108 [Fistulina hepatica ATCC 64428]
MCINTSHRDQSTKAVVADILSMNNKVTPCSIAYAAVILHFCLTDIGKWNGNDFYGMEYRELYNTIIDFFKDPWLSDDAESENEKLLQWWNEKVFPHTTALVACKGAQCSSRVLHNAARLIVKVLQGLESFRVASSLYDTYQIN